MVLIIETFYTLKVYPSGEIVFPINPENLIYLKPAASYKHNFSRYANAASIKPVDNQDLH